MIYVLKSTYLSFVCMLKETECKSRRLQVHIPQQRPPVSQMNFLRTCAKDSALELNKI